ncbi:RlpA-like double-psi beta-barrel-containing domain containing protein [Tylopilus felleus]
MFQSVIFTLLSVLYLSGTYFEVGLGACGDVDVDTEHIVALSFPLFGPGYPGEHCGKWVAITANGVTAYGKVHDKCSACGMYDLDMSPSLFTVFDPLPIGVVPITWHFI